MRETSTCNKRVERRQSDRAAACVQDAADRAETTHDEGVSGGRRLHRHHVGRALHEKFARRRDQHLGQFWGRWCLAEVRIKKEEKGMERNEKAQLKMNGKIIISNKK